MEIWKDVVDYEGLYKISSHGRVWSTLRQHGHTYRWIGGLILTPYTDADGYHLVNLHKNGKGRRRRVHQLVMRAFVGEPRKGEEVCHGRKRSADGSCCDWLSNLSYGTKKKNLGRDKRRDGTLLRHEKHPSAVLTNEQVAEIRKLYESTKDLPVGPRRWSQERLAAKFGVTRSTVGLILRGETWAEMAA
jgi:hypothetical protein